jgi:glucose-1-phosphatase
LIFKPIDFSFRQLPVVFYFCRMNKKLKNIIFDLGGVLLNIDYKLTEKAFNDLGYNNFDSMYSQFTADEIFEKLETGKISEDEFYDRMIALSNGKVSKEEIQSAWNKMLLTWRQNSISFIENLSEAYKVFLLSNTNAIHLQAFNEILEKATGNKKGLDYLFTKAYYSHKINLRKPNTDIFEFVAKDAGIDPAETLFIDDSFNNIETAKIAGFKTHLLLPGENIEQLDYESY